MTLIVLSFALIAAIDLVPLIRKKSWHDAIVLSGLWLAGVVLSVLIARGVQLPSVMLLLDRLFKAIHLSY